MLTCINVFCLETNILALSGIIIFYFVLKAKRCNIFSYTLCLSLSFFSYAHLRYKSTNAIFRHTIQACVQITTLPASCKSPVSILVYCPRHLYLSFFELIFSLSLTYTFTIHLAVHHLRKEAAYHPFL